jgi:hypothetical protein
LLIRNPPRNHQRPARINVVLKPLKIVIQILHTQQDSQQLQHLSGSNTN